MDIPTHTIGDATSVKERFGSESVAIRAERLLDVLVFNNTAGVLYMQIHEIPAADTSVAPIDTSVPKFSFPVQAGFGGLLGRWADLSGIYCCWSTTQATKTLVGAASGSINIIVRA